MLRRSSDPWRAFPNIPGTDVALRSKPFDITPVTNRTGTVSYRVTGTLRPGAKQKKKTFLCREDAEAQCDAWEVERLHGAAALRPKITHLTQQQLREAEGAFQMLKGESFSLTDAVKYRLENKPKIALDMTYHDALQKFLNRTDLGASQAQITNYRQRGKRFGEFIGSSTLIGKVDEAMMTNWLDSCRSIDGGPIKKKTWNNLFGDVSAIFAFCVRKSYLKENPFKGLKRFKKRALGAGPRKRLTAEQAQAFMAHVEKEAPKWACYFAITLFAGIRPDLRNGEMWELARCVERDGIDTYYSNKTFHLTAEITKEGVERTTKVKPNLAAWLKKYPPTPKDICPGDPKEISPLRKLFSVPHDGLRHTCISAFMALGNSYKDAADEFGNSEPIIRHHYLKKMAKKEAKAFYSIMPSRPEC